MADLTKQVGQLSKIFQQEESRVAKNRQLAADATATQIKLNLSILATVINNVEKAVSYGNIPSDFTVVVDHEFYTNHLGAEMGGFGVAVFADGTILIDCPVDEDFNTFGGGTFTEENIQRIELQIVSWMQERLYKNVILHLSNDISKATYIDNNGKAHAAAFELIKPIIFKPD